MQAEFSEYAQTSKNHSLLLDQLRKGIGELIQANTKKDLMNYKVAEDKLKMTAAIEDLEKAVNALQTMGTKLQHSLHLTVPEFIFIIYSFKLADVNELQGRVVDFSHDVPLSTRKISGGSTGGHEIIGAQLFRLLAQPLDLYIQKTPADRSQISSFVLNVSYTLLWVSVQL